MIETMTPSGVEQAPAPAAQAPAAQVIETMTPSGVEQIMTSSDPPPLAPVIETMTPSGVEQSTRSPATTGTGTSDRDDDAFGR